jgi:ABC-type nitrate/sulfonate/bicarbonate transport system permease component
MSLVASSRHLATGGGHAGRPPSLRSRLAETPWPYRLAVLAAIAATWEVYARIAHSLLIPTFSDTIVGIGTLLTTPKVYEAFLLSNQAFVVGFVLALGLGIPLGLAAARFRSLEGFIDPYLNILLVTPMAAIIPILLMSLGIGLASRVFLVVVFAIPIVIVNTRAGVRQVDPSLIEMATSYGANERQLWLKVLLPGALPAIMTAVRLGLGRAVTAMVIIELLMVSVGIGGLILNFRGTFESALLYGVVILVVAEALVLISAVRILERRLVPWIREAALSEG